MSDLKPYTITLDSGLTTELLLSDDDAKARGLLPRRAHKATTVEAEPAAQKAAPAPANKSRAARTA